MLGTSLAFFLSQDQTHLLHKLLFNTFKDSLEASGIEPLTFSLQKNYSTIGIIPPPNIYKYIKYTSSVAQWLELSAVNRKVAGSIPACGVFYFTEGET